MPLLNSYCLDQHPDLHAVDADEVLASTTGQSGFEQPTSGVGYKSMRNT